METCRFTREFPGLSSRWMLLFFIVSLSLSIYASFKVRAFSQPDESAHYFRALEVSKLHLINSVGNAGVLIPCEEYKMVGNANGPIANYVDVDQRIREATPLNPCLIKSINTAGSYSPVMYIFSAAGFAIAGYMELDYVDKQQWGRFFNAIGCTIVVFLGLCLIKKIRPLLAALAYVPMGFLLRSSLSADAVTNAVCLFYICWLIRCLERGGMLNFRDMTISILIGMVVGATKPLYSLLPFASLLLLNRKHSLSSQSGLLLPGFISVVIATVLTKASDPSLIYVPPGLIPGDQLSYILHHPIDYLFIFINTIHLNFSTLITYVVGEANLLWYVSVIVILCLTTESIFSFQQRFFILVSGFALCGATATALYLLNTPLAHAVIYGLQGRYFIMPVTFTLLAISFNSLKGLFIVPWLQNIMGYVLPLAIIVYSLQNDRVLMAWGLF